MSRKERDGRLPSNVTVAVAGGAGVIGGSSVLRRRAGASATVPTDSTVRVAVLIG